MSLISKRRGGKGYIDEVLDRKVTTREGKHWTEGMSPEQREIVNRDLKGLKIRYTFPNGIKREYRCNELKAPANKLEIPDLKKTVEQYFKDEHKVKLTYPHLPCLWLGARSKTIYIPMEFCEVKSQHLPIHKALPDKAQADMIRNTAMSPGEREKKITENLKKNNSMYKNDPFAKAFNISIADNLVSLTGRVLPPPSIDYNSNQVAINSKEPGKWNQRLGQHRYVSGGELKNWAVLDLAKSRDDELNKVVREIGIVGRKLGMNIQDEIQTNVFIYPANESEAGKKFHAIMEEFKQYNVKLDMLLVILPIKGGKVYNEIKKLGDIEYKVPTQCVVKWTLFKNGQLNGQMISNLCLKINS